MVWSLGFSVMPGVSGEVTGSRGGEILGSRGLGALQGLLVV